MRVVLWSACVLNVVAGCSLERDPFPGHFRHALLNGAREDLYDRPLPRWLPERGGAGAPAEVPPLPPRIAAAPAEVPPLPPTDEVPPLPPATARVASVSPPMAPPPIPARARRSEPREPARPASPRLSRWLRHGEAADMRRQRIAGFAASLVGSRKVVVQGRRFASNCSDFVRAVYSIEGVDLYRWPGRPRGFGGVRSLYALSKSAGGLLFGRTPRTGDLVFFHHTYDFNRNQRIDDYLSHVGIVEKVDGDGTIHYVDFSGGRVRRNQVNLLRPHLWRDPQRLKRLNSYLRSRKRTDPPGTRYLAGELFAGFGTLLR